MSSIKVVLNTLATDTLWYHLMNLIRASFSFNWNETFFYQRTVELWVIINTCYENVRFLLLNLFDQTFKARTWSEEIFKSHKFEFNFFSLIMNHNFCFSISSNFTSKNFLLSRHLNSSAHLNSLGSNTQLNCSFRFSCDQQSAHKKERIVFCCSFPEHVIVLTIICSNWRRNERRGEKNTRVNLSGATLHQSLLLLWLFFLLL